MKQKDKKLEDFFQEKIQELQQVMVTLKDKDKLSIHEMNEVPGVKKVIDEMRTAGITKQWLQDNGFIVASIMLNV